MGIAWNREWSGKRGMGLESRGSEGSRSRYDEARGCGTGMFSMETGSLNRVCEEMDTPLPWIRRDEPETANDGPARTLVHDVSPGLAGQRIGGTE